MRLDSILLCDPQQQGRVMGGIFPVKPVKMRKKTKMENKNPSLQSSSLVGNFLLKPPQPPPPEILKSLLGDVQFLFAWFVLKN